MAYIKTNSPEIRVGLESISKPKKMSSMNVSSPKSSMIKQVGSKKNPTLTNEASMPKNKKMILKRKKN